MRSLLILLLPLLLFGCTSGEILPIATFEKLPAGQTVIPLDLARLTIHWQLWFEGSADQKSGHKVKIEIRNRGSETLRCTGRQGELLVFIKPGQTMFLDDVALGSWDQSRVGYSFFNEVGDARLKFDVIISSPSEIIFPSPLEVEAVWSDGM